MDARRNRVIARRSKLGSRNLPNRGVHVLEFMFVTRVGLGGTAKSRVDARSSTRDVRTAGSPRTVGQRNPDVLLHEVTAVLSAYSAVAPHCRLKPLIRCPRQRSSYRPKHSDATS